MRSPSRSRPAGDKTPTPGSRWPQGPAAKQKKRKNPQPPFITSKLQQDAARQLGFACRKTMRVAQRLYEGREISASRAPSA